MNKLAGSFVFGIALFFMHGCGTTTPRTTTTWTLVSTTDVGPSLQETFWTAELPPSAKHMRVGLRRLFTKHGTTREGVVVYLPPSGTTARLYTASENYDFRIFLANRGYDVFSVEYRNSFVTAEADISDLAKFKTSLTLSDIQQAIARVKSLTGVDKVFLTGHSTGARYVYLYACSRWSEDLKGMIPMDGAPWEMSGPTPEGTMDINQGYAALAAGDAADNRALFRSWGMEPGPQYYDVVLTNFAPPFAGAVDTYYRQGPTAQSPVAGFATVSDYLADQFYRVWGEKQLTNVLNGYAKVGTLLDFVSKTGAEHWPLIDYMEDAYLGNWNGNPPLSDLRFTSDISSVNIPILAFASSEFKDALSFQYRWKREGYEMIKSADRQYVLLNGFGHLDVLVGEYAKAQVFSVLYNWLHAFPHVVAVPPTVTPVSPVATSLAVVRTTTITATTPSHAVTVQPSAWVDEGVRLAPANFSPPSACCTNPSVLVLRDGRVRIYATGQVYSLQNAVSSDGLTFVAQPRVTTVPRSQTREVRLEDGRVRMFFTTESSRDASRSVDVRSAISSDDGTTFVVEDGVRLAASSVGARAINVPGIVRMRDGRWRAYFGTSQFDSSSVPEVSPIRSATSNDLLNWTIDAGVRIGPGAPVLTKDAAHPTAITNADGSVTLFYPRGSTGGTRADCGIWYATSADGLSFMTETLAVPAVFFANGDVETDNNPAALRLADGSVRLYTGGGLTRAGQVFDQSNSRIKSWRGRIATAASVGQDALDALNAAVRNNDTRHIRALTDHILDSVSPVQIPVNHSLRERLYRAEDAFHHNRYLSISEDAAVDMLNSIADEPGGPAWLRTSSDELHAFRLGVKPGMPHLIGQPSSPSSGRLGLDLSTEMSPIEAVFTTVALATSKMANGGAAEVSTAYRLAFEHWLTDEESAASLDAHVLLDRLGLRR